MDERQPLEDILESGYWNAGGKTQVACKYIDGMSEVVSGFEDIYKVKQLEDLCPPWIDRQNFHVVSLYFRQCESCEIHEITEAEVIASEKDSLKDVGHKVSIADIG